MASALRKLLRPHSANRSADDKVEKGVVNVGNVGGEGVRQPYHHAARKLFSRVCRSVHHAAKVRPSDGVVVVDNKIGENKATDEKMLNHLINVNEPSSSDGKKNVSRNGHPMSESCMNHSKVVRTRRLMREYQDLCRRQKDAKGNFMNFSVELVNDNLYEWNVKLLKIDQDSELARDMRETNISCIVLNLSFPDNFPFAPPFMRVISPKIEKGFVMEGGAICMELLTPSGWASAYTIEAIIMQFSASLIKGQARIVRKTKGGKDFNKKAAEASFRSLVKTHEKYGWVTPPLADG
ncbi:ubiquitin-conjugating enzyme [Chamberlinius hualienensis]